jgi:hypothetical protein
VLQIVISQSPATAVLEPFFAKLIAADAEIPDFGWDTLEVLALGSALQIMLAHIDAAQRKRLAWARFRQAVPSPHPCQTAARIHCSGSEKFSVPL